MGFLNSEKFPDTYKPAFFKLWVERLRTAINYLDATNFPNGLSGNVITDRSLPLGKVTGLDGLVIGADFFTTPTYHSVSDTTFTGVGALVLWSPTWKTVGTIALEVTCSVENTAYPATIKLVSGAGDVYSFVESSNTQVRREFDVTSVMPATAGTLAIYAKVDDAGHPLYINSARLLYKLTE